MTKKIHIFLGSFFLFFIYILRNKILYTSEEDSPTIDFFRSCSNSAFHTYNNFEEFIENHQKCIEKFIPNMKLDEFQMGRFGESKYFLPLRETFNKSYCNWITIGIGGDILVEKMFKDKYPECSVFGVEPSPDQHDGFEEYGNIIPYGVGVKAGIFDLTLRKGKNYEKKPVAVLALADLLDTYLKTRTVLYLTIDIEGFEYSILEELLEGKSLYNKGITFCQIDAELHGFDDTRSNIKPLLHKFDGSKSPYIPIITKAFHIHRKITFVNIKNLFCQKAFSFDSLLNK